MSVAAQIGVTPVLLATFGLVPALGPFLHTPSAGLLAWVTLVARATAAVSPLLDRRSALLVLAAGGVVAACWLACAHARPGRGRDARATTSSHTAPADSHR